MDEVWESLLKVSRDTGVFIINFEHIFHTFFYSFFCYFEQVKFGSAAYVLKLELDSKSKAKFG